jgi:hypothetical protein
LLRLSKSERKSSRIFWFKSGLIQKFKQQSSIFTEGKPRKNFRGSLLLNPEFGPKFKTQIPDQKWAANSIDK